MCQLLKCGGLLKQCRFVFGLDFNIKWIEASMVVINRKYHFSVLKVKSSQLFVNFWGRYVASSQFSSGQNLPLWRAWSLGGYRKERWKQGFERLSLNLDMVFFFCNHRKSFPQKYAQKGANICLVSLADVFRDNTQRYPERRLQKRIHENLVYQQSW